MAYTYDAVGNVLQVTDALNHSTSYQYDALFRQTSVIDANGGATQYTYDPVHNLRTLTDANNNVTMWDYDGLDRVSAETNVLGDARTYRYDAVGNTRQLTDRNGRVRQFDYDNLYRTTHERWLGTGARSLDFVYAPNGNLLSASDPSATYTYQYDAQDRLTHETQVIAGLGSTITLDHGYDRVDNRVSVSATIGNTADFVTGFDYDNLYRMKSVTQVGRLNNPPGTTSRNTVTPKHVTFTYDLASQMTDVRRLSDGVVASSHYEYDKVGRVTDITHTNASSSMIADYDLEFDAANRLTQFRSYGAIDNFFADYGYDARNQLTGATYTGTVTGLTTALQNENYGYDDNGNRLNPDGTSRSPDGKDNRLQTNGTHMFAYDDEGNRIAKFIDANGTGQFDQGDTDITEYAWDHRNRLTQITQRANYGDAVDTAIIDYEYDGFDRRVSKTVDPDGDGSQTAYRDFYVYDGQHIALEFHDSDANGSSSAVVSHRYLHGPRIDMILADEQVVSGSGPGQVFWALPDHLGSTRDVIDSSGNIVTHFVYNTFGQITGETNPNFKFRFTFTGRERDAETPGLMYYRARYYSTTEGVFISNDPIGFNAGDANLYRYVGNQVTTHTDPSGLQDPVMENLEYFERLIAEREESKERKTGRRAIDVVPIDVFEEDNMSYGPIWWSQFWAWNEIRSKNGYDMVDQVKRRCDHGKLSSLTIRTHGNPKGIMVGSERHPGHLPPFRKYWITMAMLDPANPKYDAKFVAKLQELKPYFAEDARVVLWSCKGAEGNDGKRFMQLLANTLGVDVWAMDTDTDVMILTPWKSDWHVAKPGQTAPLAGGPVAVPVQPKGGNRNK